MGIREFMVECTTLPNLTMGGGRDVELQNPKRPTDYRDCGTSPFFEGDRSLNKILKKAMFAQQTITGRRTAAWNEPTIIVTVEQAPSSKVIGASNKIPKKAMFAQQTITGRRTAAWNEPRVVGVGNRIEKSTVHIWYICTWMAQTRHAPFETEDRPRAMGALFTTWFCENDNIDFRPRHYLSMKFGDKFVSISTGSSESIFEDSLSGHGLQPM